MSNPKIFLQPELIEGDNIDIAQDGKTISSNTPLENITNTDITEVEDGQALIYDETSGKWVNGEGGTPIEPNPAAAATDTLSTIKIDNTVFSIGGGGTGDAVLYPLTTAEYNALTPEQKMDENVLYLLTDGGSGGGGGTGSGYSETTLWENASGLSFVNSSPITLTLNDDISNYDMLMFELSPSDNLRWRYHNIALTRNIDKTGTNYFGSVTVGGTEGYAPGITYIDETSLSFNSWGRAYSLTIYKIIGIKFGSGGSNVVPNPEDEATDVLHSIKIDDATYAIQGGGSFIDVENRIVAPTEFTTSLTYTATEDCVVCMYLVCPGDASTFVKINNFTVQNFWQAELATGPCAPIFVRTGQTLTVTGAHTSYASNYTVYGVQSSGGGGGGTGNLNAVEMDYEDWLELSQEEREDPNIEYFLSNAPGGGGSGSGTSNLSGETVPQSSEGEDNAMYMQYSSSSSESAYETEWEGSVSTATWASPVQIGTINPSEYYRIKITGTGSGERLVSEIPAVGSGDLWHLGHEMYIYTANDCTELWLYSSTGYSNTVTKVEATTYDEGVVDSIEKVYGKIKGNWYEIATGGGTNVVPNPQGTATDTLNTIEIDGTIYDLLSDGGESNEPELIWDGDETPTTSGTDITLNKSWQDYDILIFEIYQSSSSFYSMPMLLTKDMNINSRYIQSGYSYSRFDICIIPLSDTVINIQRPTSSGSAVNYKKIYGIKLGGGSGATFEGLDYSNATDLTLPDNTGYTYTPSENGVIMVDNYGGAGALTISSANFNAIHLMSASDRWTTSWCFVEKGVEYTLSRVSSSSGWQSQAWAKFIPLKQSSSGGGGSSEINYSTEEQEIGTWIDGKPVYQKTIIISGTYSGRTSIDISSYIDASTKLISIEGIGKYTHQGDDNYYAIDGDVFIYPAGNINTLKTNWGSTTLPLEIFLTIRYTKTTD